MADTQHSCGDCGFPVQDDATSCPNCGTSITLPDDPGAGVHSEPSSPAVSPKISSTGMLFIGAGIVFAMLVIIVYNESATIMDHTNHDHGPPQTAAAPSAPLVDPKLLEEQKVIVEARPDDMDALLKFANMLHDVGRSREAIDRYAAYLAKIPDNPDARIDMGVCYFELKMYDDAIREMEAALKNHPGHQLGNFNLGVVYMNKGDNDKSRLWFQRAIDLNPDSKAGQNAAMILKQLK